MMGLQELVLKSFGRGTVVAQYKGGELALMSSDSNLMVMAMMAVIVKGFPGFGLVRLPWLLINSLWGDTAWYRLYI